MKMRYNKKYTQEEAKNLVNRSNRSTPLQQHQASLAWTPPPIYTAVPNQDQASTRNTHTVDETTDRHRQEGRYRFLVPETVTETQLAMPAGTTIGDGLPDVSNLW